MATDDENPQLKVHKLGPLLSWSKPNGWKSTSIVLKTALQEYQLDSTEFSNDYSAALKNAKFVENFFGSLPQNNEPVNSTPVTNVTKQKKKPKPLYLEETEFVDLDEEISPAKRRKRHSSDEDFTPIKKSAKYKTSVKSFTAKSKTNTSSRSRNASTLDSSYKPSDR